MTLRARLPRALALAAALAGAVLLVVLGGAALAGYHLAREAEPLYGGRARLQGLDAPVAVTFGAHAVPHVRAASSRDLFFAQGYLVARERLWQMDLLRRMARGRLAEVAGSRAVAVDRLFRLVGLEAAARASIAVLGEEVRSYLQAYADGVNAYRREAQRRLPLEYRLAAETPQPWEMVDSAVILEYMSFLLSFNARHELTFLKVAARIGLERALELFPVGEGEAAPPYPPEIADAVLGTGHAAGEVAAVLAAAAAGAPADGPASNSWLVTGERSESGLPLLANDPHLAVMTPSVWYEMELEAPGFHAYGLCLPGVPFFLIGHNEDLAWGLTTAMADTQDIVLERLVPGSRSVERADGAAEALAERTELIRVRGRSEPETLRVRSTRSGVVLNDVLDRRAGLYQDFPVMESRYLLVLRSTLPQPDTSLAGLYHMNRAGSVEDFLAGAHRVRRASQNVMYAHRDGPVGSYVSGGLPLRRKGNGAFPEPGWVEGYGWDRLMAPEENPATTGAGPTGVRVAANDRLVPAEGPLRVSSAWMPPYRAERIRELLGERDRMSVSDLARVQTDVISLEARRYREALLRVEAELRGLDPEAAEIGRRYLLSWDGRAAPDSASAAFFALFRLRFAAALLGDELGPELVDVLRIGAAAYNPLQEAVFSGRSSFWDDVGTAVIEGPAHVWARALLETQAEVVRRVGDPERLRLERIKRLTFPHSFHALPLVGRFFDVGPIAQGGDDHTVSVLKAPLGEPDHVQVVPSYRVVFTPGDWGATRGTNTLGQSGHRFSPFRDDQLEHWASGKGHPWRWGGPPPEEVIGVLRLTPL